MTYQVGDLNIGDLATVEVHIARNGEEWIVQILIERRPGGIIPPPQGDLFAGTGHSMHMRFQSEQDWEEKGTPIPVKYLDSQGRAPWMNPPYPPVTPMPRTAAPAKP